MERRLSSGASVTGGYRSGSLAKIVRSIKY